MTTSKSAVGCLVGQRLVELLEEVRQPAAKTGRLSFGERLDALEAEALVNCAPGATLIVIRVAREVVDFAERLGMPSQRA